jgi:hypothetical protein
MRALAFALLVAAAGSARPARAGPLEAREAWRRAQALRVGPWRPRMLALREAAGLAAPGDSLRPRALAAQADLLRGLARVHAAAALDACALAAVPRRDPDRAARLLDAARALLGDGDREAARGLAQSAAEEGRGPAAWLADEALELLVTLSGEERARERLAALAAMAERDGARAATRIEAAGALGLALLEAGDEPGARRELSRAERAFRDSGREDLRDQARAAKAWLDLSLRRRLAR